MNDLDASLIPAREAAWEICCAVRSGVTSSSAVLLALARTDVMLWMIGYKFQVRDRRKLNEWGAKNGYVPVWSAEVNGCSRIRHWEAT
jgi:hypothetical protein